jgi:large subunit ribosomal protein L22
MTVPGAKTNEREGTRAVLRYGRVSPYKVRAVLDLVRGRPVALATEILQGCERDAATVVGKVLASAVANAENNDGLDREELYVSACFADEGPTLRRFRPRARGRGARIRKRSCHVTVIVTRLPEEELRRLREKRTAEQATRRARRVAGGRRGGEQEAPSERAGRFRRGRRAAAAGEEPVADQVTAAEVPALAEAAEATQEQAAAEVAEASAETTPGGAVAPTVGEEVQPGEQDRPGESGTATQGPAEGEGSEEG